MRLFRVLRRRLGNRGATGSSRRRPAQASPEMPPPPLQSAPGSVRLVMADGTVASVADAHVEGRIRYLADNLLPVEAAETDSSGSSL